MKNRVAGKPRTAQRAPNDARQRIIARSAGLLNARGYLRVPMSEITRVTGLKRGGIYHHFKSREALAIETFRYAAGMVVTKVSTVLAGEGSSADKLIALVRIFRDFRRDDVLKGGCPVVNLSIESDDGNPRVADAAREVMTRLIGCFARVIEEGVQRGNSPRSMPARTPRTWLPPSKEESCSRTSMAMPGISIASPIASRTRSGPGCGEGTASFLISSDRSVCTGMGT